NYETEKENMDKILSLFPKTSKKQNKKDHDKDLFEKLRNLRKQLADERKVPPFIIFGDASLHEMATNFPTNKQEFLQITGVGEKKLKDFGDFFIEVIKNHVSTKTPNKTPDKNSDKIPDKEPDKNSDKIPNKKSDYHEKLEKIKEEFPNAYEPWNEEEDSLLKALYLKKALSIDKIAQILKRQPSAIKERLKKHGLVEE
ncbi:HRDC domain-containing protein, partial [Candidatus Pacearchaeota archaeon]|nr:HRDC domain-containing protein [Candidatus Pacearchaeota archaeon]